MPSIKFKRNLFPWEIREFKPIFENTVDWGAVWVMEHDPIPDRIGWIGRVLKRQKPPKDGQHNAITWGNRCCFPVGMPKYLLPRAHAEAYKTPWLLHELTHTWQFQHMGWRYLSKALWAHAKYGRKVYDYGGEQGLIQHRASELTLFDFNLERQAKIVEDYYRKQRWGRAIDAYLPYIDDIRGRA